MTTMSSNSTTMAVWAKCANHVQTASAALSTIFDKRKRTVFGEMPTPVLLRLVWALTLRFLIILAAIKLILSVTALARKYARRYAPEFCATPAIAFMVFGFIYFPEAAAVLLSCYMIMTTFVREPVFKRSNQKKGKL
ncbi:hypothetical protein GGS20DRAFT_133060 [Poronia punctata]|nr:hypothetical protein GGS20DRAFT_133060 [Poronia punctata]